MVGSLRMCNPYKIHPLTETGELEELKSRHKMTSRFGIPVMLSTNVKSLAIDENTLVWVIFIGLRLLLEQSFACFACINLYIRE